MEQQQYQSYEPDVGYKPRQVIDYIQSLDRQSQIYEADEQRQSAVQQLSDANQKTSSSIKARELEQLAQYSASLTKQLVERQNQENKKEMQRGIADAYLNGTDRTALKQGEQELKQADGVIQQTAKVAEEQGGDVFAGDAIRKSSGWYKYGLAIGMVRQGAATYPAFFEQAKTETSVILTNPDGSTKEVTLQTAETPAEYQAVMAEIRSQFLDNYVGVNPQILDEYLFKQMQAHEDQQYKQWAQTRAEELKNEAIDDSLNNFSNGLTDINQAYDALVAAGISKTKAKELVLTQAYMDFAGGHISEEQYNAIIDSPFGPGGTWRSSNRRLLADIQDRIKTENIQDSNREQQAINAAARDDVREARELLLTTDNQLTNDQITEEIIDPLIEKHAGADPSIFKPLYDYRDNMSMQSRDEQEQQQALDALYASGELSVAELQSGKYSQDVVINNMGRAQQSDAMRQQAGQQAAASNNQKNAVNNAILGPAGVTNINDIKDPSILFALDAAQAEWQKNAMELKIANPDMSWDEAYRQSAMALVSEIKVGTEDPSSKWYIDKTTKPGYPSMPSFVDKGDNANAQTRANHELLTIREQAIEQGEEALKPEAELFTYDEVQHLSNPNNSPTLKLETFVRAHNARGDLPKITVAEARAQLVENYGYEMERPYEKDPYEEVMLSDEMQDLVAMDTPATIARVAEQGGLPNLQIRTGTQGAKDVLQVSLALDIPPAIAPLASAVWANESGWGKSESGRNNMFGIKGPGTTRTTREGAINQGGGTTITAEFRDYRTRSESVLGFWQHLQNNPRYAAVLTAKTPMEALKELKKAGYATNPTYVQDVARVWRDMGINPNVPYEPKNVTGTPWGDTRTMSPTAAVYISGNIGPTSTGPHLDVKRVDRKYFDYNDLDGYVMVDDPELGMVPLGKLPQTGDWASHTRRGSHGRDYGTYSGTKIFLTNGAKVVSSRSTAHGDLLIIELPNGVQYSFLHGRTN